MYKKRKYLFDFLFSSFLFSIFSFYNDSIFCRVKTMVIRYFFCGTSLVLYLKWWYGSKYYYIFTICTHFFTLIFECYLRKWEERTYRTHIYDNITWKGGTFCFTSILIPPDLKLIFFFFGKVKELLILFLERLTKKIEVEYGIFCWPLFFYFCTSQLNLWRRKSPIVYWMIG